MTGMSEEQEHDLPNERGTLRIYFGYAAGVGKTYAMLEDAKTELKRGIDVLVGYIGPHASPATVCLLSGLPVLPPKTIPHGIVKVKEFDLDEALKKKPGLIVVDDLAHTNTVGGRNKKRYQDIEELLNAGIDVYTTLNVQHIESLCDAVQNSCADGNKRETVPDYVFDHADTVRLVDIDPDDLLARYGERHFDDLEAHLPRKDELRLLREIAFKKTSDHISRGNRNGRRHRGKTAGIKLLVCIGPSPSSAKCLRWAARTSEAFHAPWVAVYVQELESGHLSEEQGKTIKANMDLAEKLGAEVVTLSGHEIAETVAEYAKVSGITNIVVGKSRNKKTLRNAFEMDLEDKLISLIPGVEVHIIPGDVSGRSYKRPRRVLWEGNIYLSLTDTMKTIGLLAAATLISLGFRALELRDQNIIMTYLLFVLLISRATTGYVYGVAASVLCVLLYNFFFAPPQFTLQAVAGYPVTLAIMLLVALATSTLTVKVKAQVRLAVERERRTEVLYEVSKNLLSTRDVESIAMLTNEYIIKLFGRSVAFYTADPVRELSMSILRAPKEKDASFLSSENEKAVAHWVFVNQKPAGAGTDTLANAEAFYLPIISQGRVLGVLGISCVTNPVNHSHFLFLRMIVSQVAMALERQHLSDEQRRMLVESEKEKMRSNLLRAISHDLRTPLTGILGASSAILESDWPLDRQTHDKLVTNIKEDSRWLIRMVENLLSVTRISEDTMNVAKTPEAAEEVVAEATARIRKIYPDRTISVSVPDELLIVPMDGTLIVQVLINLLENAVKHSSIGSPIKVEISKISETAVFEVHDNGEGIPEDVLPHLFDGYISNKQRAADSSRGMGIGLSICKSIIKAHRGNLEAVNRESGGSTFRFTLPLENGEKHGQ